MSASVCIQWHVAFLLSCKWYQLEFLCNIVNTMTFDNSRMRVTVVVGCQAFHGHVLSWMLCDCSLCIHTKPMNKRNVQFNLAFIVEDTFSKQEAI